MHHVPEQIGAMGPALFPGNSFFCDLFVGTSGRAVEISFVFALSWVQSGFILAALLISLAPCWHLLGSICLPSVSKSQKYLKKTHCVFLQYFIKKQTLFF